MGSVVAISFNSSLMLYFISPIMMKGKVDTSVKFEEPEQIPQYILFNTQQ